VRRRAPKEISAPTAHDPKETAQHPHALDITPALQRDEWLVGRGYLSAESISLVLAGPDDHTDKEIKEEVAQLQPA
jgi:hypothetical protein